MKATPPAEQGEASPNRLLSIVIYLAIFLIVAYGGWWIHVHVLPLPVESLAAGIARYLYFLLWLVALVYLFTTILFGHTFRKSQRAGHFVVGLFLGYLGGFYFAGHLGMLVGLVSGFLAAPITFRIRKRTNTHHLVTEPIEQKEHP